MTDMVCEIVNARSGVDAIKDAIELVDDDKYAETKIIYAKNGDPTAIIISRTT